MPHKNSPMKYYSITLLVILTGLIVSAKPTSATNQNPATSTTTSTNAITTSITPKSPWAAQANSPSRTEIITPIINKTFNKQHHCRQRRQGGHPRMVNGYLVFNGSMDGNRQVDPQIAVGGGYVLHATNSGVIIYDKKGNFVDGISQNCFNGGIDPKLFFDPHNRIFGFDYWKYWNKKQKKPVNISVSATSNPRGRWYTYAIPSPDERDGGGIGYSRKWIGYSFPGGKEQTFILKTAQLKAGLPATVYHFTGSLGQPVFTQDNIDDLYFFRITRRDFIINKVITSPKGIPQWLQVTKRPHHLRYNSYPPKSPQKGTTQKTASGDRNPKNVVLQNGYLWFSQAINYHGRSAVQWCQIRLNGTIVQKGIISNPKSSYIQTTIAVNKYKDMLVGFQETSPDMYISPRMAFRLASDPPGTLRPIVKLGQGHGATRGTAWGDYSGTVIDGDNLTDLWTIQSIADKTGRGDTVIAKVHFKNPHIK